MKVLLNKKIKIFDQTSKPTQHQTDYVLLDKSDTVEVIENETEQFKCYLTITEIEIALDRIYYGIDEMKKEYKSGPSYFNSAMQQYISWWIFSKDKNDYVFFGVTNLTKLAEQLQRL